MRKPFKPIWQYLVADAESEQLRALQRYRERYPDRFQQSEPLPTVSVQKKAVQMGFLLLFAYVAYTWWCHMTGGEP